MSVTGTQRLAHEELIEAETLAAEHRLAHCPELVAYRPGFYEAVVNTLGWAWCGTASPPLKVGHPKVG